jgi:hypothetical protein
MYGFSCVSSLLVVTASTAAPIDKQIRRINKSAIFDLTIVEIFMWRKGEQYALFLTRRRSGGL